MIVEAFKKGYMYFTAFNIIYERKKKTGTGASVSTPPATGRASTPNKSTNAKKAVFTDGAVHYIFGNWIYVTVK